LRSVAVAPIFFANITLRKYIFRERSFYRRDASYCGE